MKINWRIQFVELLVVILGISIAFAFDKYGEKLKEEREMTVALNSIVDDLERDVNLFNNGQIPTNQNRVDQLDFILNKLRNEELENDTLDIFIGRIMGSANTRITTATYETLKSSGKLDNIPDHELKKKIINHYESNYKQSDYLSNSNIAYSEKLRDFLTENSSVLFDKDYSDKKLLTNPIFRNMISVWRSKVNFKVLEYKRMSKSSAELAEAIKAYLQ